MTAQHTPAHDAANASPTDAELDARFAPVLRDGVAFAQGRTRTFGVPPGVRLLVVLSDSYRHGPGAVKSG